MCIAPRSMTVTALLGGGSLVLWGLCAWKG
jgi:hypothetical protein